MQTEQLLAEAQAAVEAERRAVGQLCRAQRALELTPRFDRGSGRERIRKRIEAEQALAAAERDVESAEKRADQLLQELEALISPVGR